MSDKDDERARFEILLEDIRHQVGIFAEGHRMLYEHMERRAAEVDARFEQSTRHIDFVANRLEARIDRVEQRLEQKIESTKVELEQKIESAKVELRDEIRAVASRVDDQEARIEALERSAG